MNAWLSCLLISAVLAVVLLKLRDRLLLSAAKHRSLAGHVRMARLVARRLPHYEFTEAEFFDRDGAPADVAKARRAGFAALGAQLRHKRGASSAAFAELGGRISDVTFIRRYRVPFPFSRLVAKHLPSGVMVEASEGVRLRDVDGNRWLDVGGAYGVNVFGYDFYKECLHKAQETVGELGPALGPYHPIIVDTADRLCAISGHEEVSFHMSGTEAVMQAVRLARYHTRRSHVVRFAGAYHGWWDDVQPGIGNPGRVGAVYTLAEMSEATLRVLRNRRNIACVLVNPLQALHPNTNAPGDGALVAQRSGRSADRATYGRWLQQLREVCRERGIVLIFDEVFVGFRLARRGAQEYYGVKADLVTYGKTLGGGLPVGVVCGTAALMRRFRPRRPLDICFARGTFNAHPWVVAAMNAFLHKLDQAPIQALYNSLDASWEQRARRLNEALAQARLPVQAANLSSIFTLCYPLPSRYHWLYQFYLNAEGLLLPWVGTGRLIFSLNYSDAEFNEVIEAMRRAGQRMVHDRWWWQLDHNGAKALRAQMRREIRRAFFQRASGSPDSEVTIGS